MCLAPGLAPADFLTNPDFSNGLEGWSTRHVEWLECYGSATATWDEEAACGPAARLDISGAPASISVEQRINRRILAGERISFVVGLTEMTGFGNWAIGVFTPDAFEIVDPSVHHCSNPVVPEECRDQLHEPPERIYHVPGPSSEGCHIVEFEVPADIEAGCWIALSAVVWPGEASVWFGGVYAGRVVWHEDFEDVSGGSIPPGWAHGGGHTDYGVDCDVSCESDRSLRLLGVVGGCWAAIVSCPIHPDLSYVRQFTVEFDVRNGTEDIYGCHPFRAALTMAPTPHWIDTPQRRLFMVQPDGALEAANGEVIANLLPDACYTLRIEYSRVSPGAVQFEYWVDGEWLATLADDSRENEDDLVWFHWASEEGSAWFDDITVSVCHLIGDLDADGDVDLSDLAAVLGAYGACEGDPAYNSAADLDCSGCVNLSDLAELLAHYGESCP
jgi:hypothetical protein